MPAASRAASTARSSPTAAARSGPAVDAELAKACQRVVADQDPARGIDGLTAALDEIHQATTAAREMVSRFVQAEQQRLLLHRNLQLLEGPRPAFGPGLVERGRRSSPCARRTDR